MTTDPSARAVDPRVERSRQVILEATLQLLGEVGYGALAVEAIATRAGVGKSTIYRHWCGKLDLVEDALATLKTTVLIPDAGTFRERLSTYLTEIAAALNDSTWSSCLPAMIDAAERDSDVREMHRSYTCGRREVLESFLKEGMAAGDLAEGTDVRILAEALIGPILARRLLLHEAYPLDEVGRIVDQLVGPTT